MKTLLKDMIKGLWKENPVLVLLLGSCPTLATTSSAANGLAMGIATTAVLCGSNLVISLIAGIVPKKIRIPVYIVTVRNADSANLQRGNLRLDKANRFQPVFKEQFYHDFSICMGGVQNCKPEVFRLLCM